MRIVNGSQVRVLVNLTLLRKPDVTADRIVTIQAGVKVEALAVSENGWLHCIARGWEHEGHPGYMYSDAHVNKYLDALRRAAQGWTQREYIGYISLAQVGWYKVEDGLA